MTTAIDIQGISKRFRLYHEKYSSLKERVLHLGHVPYDEFWALKDVSFEITSGHTVGILGRNGSGKSTMLKCIAGILQPTRGRVVVRGQLAAMLELGAGFQPELSGRDNIYLNGSLLGLSRREIARRFDAIVEFAELEQFIDNQVKYYSSGMYVRLGFAVAVNVEPDVLLVDEVLAVGDERFQEKCLERVRQFQREGRTIVVVSHAADMLRPICDEIVVLERGELVTVAQPGEAIRVFREHLMQDGVIAPNAVIEDATEIIQGGTTHHPKITITSVSTDFPGFGERPYLISGEPLAIRVEYDVAEPLSGVRFQIALLSERDEILFSSQGEALSGGDVLDAGPGSVVFHFDSMLLLDGRFTVNLSVRGEGGVSLALAEPACHFEVMNPGRAIGVVALPMRIEMPDALGRAESAERVAP
jgi:ABC-2 type transport system ATP-binding protein